MTSTEVQSIAEQRGFTLSAIVNVGNKQNTRFIFIDKDSITLIVDRNNNFKFSYLIPHSIFSLECPECSPFTNNKHFGALYKKFRTWAYAIDYADSEMSY